MSKFLLQILKVATENFPWNWGSWKVGLEKILWSSSCLVNLQTAGLQHYLKLSPSQVFFKEFAQQHLQWKFSYTREVWIPKFWKLLYKSMYFLEVLMNLIGSFLRKYTGFSKSIVVCEVSRLAGFVLGYFLLKLGVTN